VSLLMVAVVVLFAPALLGLVLAISKLESHFLNAPVTREPRPVRRARTATPADGKAPGKAPAAPRDQVARQVS
jgi:hypothetical protein